MERDIKNHFNNPIIKSDVRNSTEKIINTFSRSSKNEEAYTDIPLFTKGNKNHEMDSLFGN